MEAVLLVLAAAAGAGGVWWYQSRPRYQLTAGSDWDEDAEVVLHVAQHEARTRGQALSSLHILYGLIQDEVIVETLREAGHDPEAFESCVLDALAKQTPMSTGITERAQYMFAYALHSSRSAERKASRVDLWAYLKESDADEVLATAKVSHVDILFRLAHGMAPPALDTITTDVHVVLRNDDYTTRDFVCSLLTGTFGYTEDAAETRTMQVHTEGRGVVERLSATEARSQIARARELARSHGFPLWIGAEPT